MRIKIFKLIFVVVFLISSQVLVVAESDENYENKDVLNVELSTTTQDPKTKEFDIVATINSEIDSDRVVVETSLSDYIVFVNEDDKQISTKVRANVVNPIHIRVKPVLAMPSKVTVVVTLIKADVYYTSSDTINLTFNDKKELLPITSAYQKAKYLYFFKNFSLVLIAIIAVILSIRFVVKRFRSNS